MSEIIHRNRWDSIAGKKLEGSARQIRPMKGEPIIFGNDFLYVIDRIGGINCSCKLIKESEYKSIISDLIKTTILKIFTDCNHSLAGDILYCECDREPRIGVTTLSGSHKGKVGDFRSKQVALSIIFKVFTQTKVYASTESYNICNLKEDVKK